jgi:hypothetical protein
VLQGEAADKKYEEIVVKLGGVVTKDISEKFDVIVIS